jgi:hypothetical protein
MNLIRKKFIWFELDQKLGCWVSDEYGQSDFQDDQVNDVNTSIGVVTTGCGEHIMKTLFAKECSDHIFRSRDLLNYDLNDFFRKKFFSKFLKNPILITRILKF